MAYFNNDVEAAEKIAQTLASYPDTSWDNVDRLVRRAMSQYGYRPESGRAVVLKVVDILKSQGKFNDWGDPNMILPEASAHRRKMDDHFKRAREYLYGFPTDNPKEDEKVTDDAGSTTTVMTAGEVGMTEDDANDVADDAVESDDDTVEEAADARLEMSDELAAKKIADKLKGTPDLTFAKIQAMVPRYLQMVGKAPTAAKHLSVLVFDELQDLELAESNVATFEASPAELDMADELGDQAYLDQRVSDYMADVAATQPQRSEYVAYGRKFETVVFDDIDLANEFMSENPGWGAIGETPDGMYHLAHMEDEGSPIEEASEMVGHDHTGDLYHVADHDVAQMLFPGNPKLADDFVALSSDIMHELDYADDKQAVVDEMVADANQFLKQHGIDEFHFTGVDVSDPENFVWVVKHTGEDEVEEAQEAIIKIPRDQSKSFANEVEVGGVNGPEQNMDYIMRMRALAGIK